MAKIESIKAREIIDSRGNPTVEVELNLEGGGSSTANVGSGSSIGSYEMHELRDGDLGRLRGRGVTRVVENINHYLAPQIIGMEFGSQKIFDQHIIGLDGTPSLEHFGANGILCLSCAYAQAEADHQKEPAFRSFQRLRADAPVDAKLQIPKPMINIFNGGKLAAYSTDAQEFNIVVKSAGTFSQALQIGADIYHAVGQILQKSGFGKQVGDEGGYSVPNATTDQGMQLIVEGTQLAGHKPEDIGIILDVAASNLFTDARLYHLAHHDGDVPAQYLIDKFAKLHTNFPLMGVEDGLADQDWEGWIEMSRQLMDRMMIIGDDIFSTNALRLQKGAADKVANAIMIKPNQIGTLTGAVDAILEALKLGYTPILSHRSGDTENPLLAHMAVGLQVPYVKFGAPARGERVAKYNELLRIEELLVGD